MAVCRQNCSQVIFTIEKGEGLKSVARRLEEEKLIKNDFAFLIRGIFDRADRQIQAGNFYLDAGMSPGQIMRELAHGTLDVRVTLLEGWRREEIAEELAGKLESGSSNFKKSEFLKLTSNLEGRLFPDTYFFSKGAEAAKIVNALSQNFEKRTAGLNITPKILILASLVEREAREAADRPIVAGILFRRLENDWPLQVDATVQYARANLKCKNENLKCDWWAKELTKADLAVNSPFNTYLYPDLPPSPIANPGLASIRAALNPAKTDYLYYLTGKDGQMHYAKTLEEHNANVQKYLFIPE